MTVAAAAAPAAAAVCAVGELAASRLRLALTPAAVAPTAADVAQPAPTEEEELTPSARSEV